MSILKNLTIFIIVSSLSSSAFAEATPKQVDTRDILKQKMHDRMIDADVNNDHIITEAEYMAQSLNKFRKMDFNGDGQVTQDELNKKLTAQ